MKNLIIFLVFFFFSLATAGEKTMFVKMFEQGKNICENPVIETIQKGGWNWRVYSFYWDSPEEAEIVRFTFSNVLPSSIVKENGRVDVVKFQSFETYHFLILERVGGGDRWQMTQSTEDGVDFEIFHDGEGTLLWKIWIKEKNLPEGVPWIEIRTKD